MQFFLIFFFSALLNFANAAETVKLKDYSNSPSEIQEFDHKFLKLEARIKETLDRIELLNQQISKLDLVQSKLVIRVNELLGKNNKGLDKIEYDNNAEFEYGFRMVQLRKFAIAKDSFLLFIKKYPADPRLGDAYFWLGEIEHKQNNYKEASQYYLTSYKDFPMSIKRNQALYKLSLCLGLLNQTKESCAGLDLIINDIPTVSNSLRLDARREYDNFGCGIKKQ